MILSNIRQLTYIRLFCQLIYPFQWFCNPLMLSQQKLWTGKRAKTLIFLKWSGSLTFALRWSWMVGNSCFKGKNISDFAGGKHSSFPEKHSKVYSGVFIILLFMHGNYLLKFGFPWKMLFSETTRKRNKLSRAISQNWLHKLE